MSDDTGLDSTMLSRTSGASSTCTPADFEHRLELLAHDVQRPRDERRLALFASSSLRVSSTPQRSTQRATSQRGCDPSSASASIGSASSRQRPSASRSRSRRRSTAFASLLAPNAVAALRELDGLRDRGVRRHAAHVQQLRGAEPQQIEQIGVEANDAAAHARVEQRVEPSAAAQHAVHELANPAAIARVEPRRPAIERRIEQLAGAQVRADLRRRKPRVGDARRAVATPRPHHDVPAIANDTVGRSDAWPRGIP